MKGYILFFCVILIHLITFSQNNHSYGPEFEQNWSSIPSGMEHFVGVNAAGPIVEYVCFVNWQWNEDVFTQHLSVESVVLRFRAEYENNVSKIFNFTLHSVEDPWESIDVLFYQNEIVHNDNRKIFQDNIQSNSNGVALYEKTITNQDLLNYIESRIKSENELTMVFRSEDELDPWWNLRSYDGSSGYYDPAVELTINYSTIPQNYQFVNKIELSEDYGSIVLKNNENLQVNTINSGDDINLDPAIIYSVRTYELPFVVDWNSTGKTQKHNNWIVNAGKNYVMSYDLKPDLTTTNSKLTAEFFETKHASIHSYLESDESNAAIEFKDPWLYYESGGEWNHSNTLIEYPTPKELNNSAASHYGGVFLDQGYNSTTQIWTQPYYKVKAPAQTINVNGSDHQIYFLNWEATNATMQNAYSEKTGVAFHADNAEVTANYKGSRLSTDQNAVRGWSQRKMARTSDGSLHLVYESMGKVWYEYSTDNGNTWNLINLQNGESKLPSIDTFGNQVGIVYQEKSGSDTYFRIHIFNSGDDTDQYSGAPPFETGYNDYKPVIGMSGNGRVFVAFINSSNVVKWCLYYIDPGDMGPGSQGIISQSSNVKNISVASDKSQDDLYHIVWQSGTQSIKYIKNYFGASSDYSWISTGSGFEDHRRPEVTVVSGNPIAAWVGERTEGGATDTSVSKISAFGGGLIGGGDSEIEKRAIVREYTGSGWSSTFDKYGQDVVDIAISSTGSNYALAFHREYDGLVYQDGDFIQGTVRITKGITDDNPSNIETLSENGGLYYFSNSSTVYNMHGVDIDQLATSSPYSLRTSSLFSPSKVAANDSVYIGREGVCRRDSIQFYFTFGEIFVDGMPVFFNEPPKDLKEINNTNKMNKYLVSEPFVLDDNSSFTYGMMCGLADSSDAGIALSKNEQISFKIELVDESNKEVLGIYDNVTFSSEDTMYFANRDYTVKTNGIGNKTVRLRLQITDNFKQDYTLGNLIADKDGLFKKGFETIHYKGELLVKDYTLVQNYPNPFNPSTIIKYQIPKEGIVKLKVYDILGREVTTLVDKYQVDGRYEVEFNASNLSSGVYIYRLEVNDFVTSKKMIMIK